METGADISECGKYRYMLWRIWHPNKPKLAFIMLNPSTANASHNDATIKRCIKFAATNGYGGIVVANLFAYRSTDPKLLPTDETAIGPNNDFSLCIIANKSITKEVDVCFAWGTDKRIKDRAVEVSKFFSQAYCLEKTKHGQPKHPLFIRADAKLIPYY